MTVSVTRHKAGTVPGRPPTATDHELAERRAASIRQNAQNRYRLLTEGLEAGDWRTLGYESPAAWWSELTGYEVAPAAIRKRLAAALRAEGYSIRAIAGELDVSRGTAARDVSNNGTPAPEAVTGRDGKTYPLTQVQRVLTEPPAPEPVPEPPAPEPAPATTGPAYEVTVEILSGHLYGMSYTFHRDRPLPESGAEREQALINVAATATMFACQELAGLHRKLHGATHVVRVDIKYAGEQEVPACTTYTLASANGT